MQKRVQILETGAVVFIVVILHNVRGYISGAILADIFRKMEES